VYNGNSGTSLNPVSCSRKNALHKYRVFELNLTFWYLFVGGHGIKPLDDFAVIFEYTSRSSEANGIPAQSRFVQTAAPRNWLAMLKTIVTHRFNMTIHTRSAFRAVRSFYQVPGALPDLNAGDIQEIPAISIHCCRKGSHYMG